MSLFTDDMIIYEKILWHLYQSYQNKWDKSWRRQGSMEKISKSIRVVACIPLYNIPPIFLSIHLFMSIRVVSHMGPMQIKLLWALCRIFVFRHLDYFQSEKCLGMEWLNHMVDVCLTLKETPKLFSKVYLESIFQNKYILYTYQQIMRVPVVPHPHQHFICQSFLSSPFWWF